MNEYSPMKAIIGGLLEPVVKTEESIMWENVLHTLVEGSQTGKIEEALEHLEIIYKIEKK
jgi:hypothetical protein